MRYDESKADGKGLRNCMDTQDLQLLNAISAFGDFTAAKLAEKLGISERNARERLKRLESEIHLHGGQIVSKPGKGYSFQITQENQFSAWLSSINKDEHSIPTTTHGRVSYILDRLLYAEGFLKLDDLCDELYIPHNDDGRYETGQKDIAAIPFDPFAACRFRCPYSWQ